MQSYWEILPLDILLEFVKYFDTLSTIYDFCNDPVVSQKMQTNKNHLTWTLLFNRDFTDNIKIKNSKPIMVNYLQERERFEKLKRDNETKMPIHGYKTINSGFSIGGQFDPRNIQKLKVSSKLGYEKITQSIAISMVSDEAINESFILATIYDNVLITSYLFSFTQLYQLSYCTMKRHEMKGSDLEYALILAAQFGYMKYVKLLLEKGADLNLAMHESSESGGLAVFKAYEFFCKNNQKIQQFISKHNN